MPIIDLRRDTQPHFAERLQALTPETERRWGSLTPIGLLAHLRRSIEVSLGEVAVEDQSTLLSRTLVRWLAIHLMRSWPRGKIKVPEVFIPAPEEDFEKERAHLLDAIERFVEAQAADPARRTRHPVLGEFTLQGWGHVHGRHFRHHFEQFGV